MAIRAKKSAFGAALYPFCIALFVSNSPMYVVENTGWPKHFSSIPTTMWWSLITLTTVGYGDVSPVDAELASWWVPSPPLWAVCVVALLTGIVAAAFANQISKRHGLFEAEIAAMASFRK